MLYLILMLLTSVLASIFSLYIIKCKLTSPLSLHTLPWVLVCCIGIITYDSFIPLSFEVFLSFNIWYLTLFVIFSINEISIRNINSGLIYNNYTFISKRYWVILIPMSIYTAYEIYIVGNSGANSFLLNLRLAYLDVPDYAGERFKFTQHAYTFVLAIFIISCITKNKLNLLLSLFWMILFFIASMGKLPIITVIAIYFVIYETTKNIKKRRILVVIPIIILTLMILHFLRMSDNDTNTIYSVLGTYIYSPIVAFGTLSTNTDDTSIGIYTFRFIYAFLYKSGFITEVPTSTILDYVYIPTPTNVYTAMQPFYSDFSFYGIIFGAIIYGVIYSFIYNLARRGYTLFLLFYASMSISLIMSFFAETLLLNLSGNVKLIITITLLYILTVKCKIKSPY